VQVSGINIALEAVKWCSHGPVLGRWVAGSHMGGCAYPIWAGGCAQMWGVAATEGAEGLKFTSWPMALLGHCWLTVTVV